MRLSELGRTVVEIEAEAPNPVAVSFAVAAADTADLTPGRLALVADRDRSGPRNATNVRLEVLAEPMGASGSARPRPRT